MYQDHAGMLAAHRERIIVEAQKISTVARYENKPAGSGDLQMAVITRSAHSDIV